MSRRVLGRVLCAVGAVAGVTGACTSVGWILIVGAAVFMAGVGMTLD
jgi:hypothetical protein